MSKTHRMGINARRQLELSRELKRDRRKEQWRALSRAGRGLVVSLVILAVLGTAAWGGLSYWHKKGGGVLRGIECRGEIACRGEEWMHALHLERGVPLEAIDLSAVERFLEERLHGKVEVVRDLGEGILVVEARSYPLLARFKKGDEWWVLRSNGRIEPNDGSDRELPLMDAAGPIDWERVARFLDQLRVRGELWRELSHLQIEEGGKFGNLWLLSGHHRLLLSFDAHGIEGMERYRRYLRYRPEVRSGNTIDLRFEGFAYVSAT